MRWVPGTPSGRRCAMVAISRRASSQPKGRGPGRRRGNVAADHWPVRRRGEVALAGLGEKIALEHELGVEVVHQVTPHGKAAS